MRIGDFAEAAFIYCTYFNMSVTSWYRTQLHNAEVGGMETSLHPLGLAIDGVYDGARPSIDKCQAIAKRLGLYVYREGTHDHVRPLDIAT